MMQEVKKQELVETIVRAGNSIDLWKRHLIRRADADMHRNNIIDNLADDEVLLVLDWSMKLPLPMKHREKQDNWFGKAGSSIHISYALWKWENHGYQYMVFVHVLQEKEDQNTEVVLTILEDIFTELKKDRVHKVYLRSDQAGCYKSSINVAAMKYLMDRTEVQVKSVTFSEAQAGKSLCDTYSSVIKNKLLDYVSSGGNVEIPAMIMEALDWAFYAMESNVKGNNADAELCIRTRLIQFAHSTTKHSLGRKSSIPQMRSFNAFEFEGEQKVRVSEGGR